MTVARSSAGSCRSCLSVPPTHHRCVRPVGPQELVSTCWNRFGISRRGSVQTVSCCKTSVNVVNAGQVLVTWFKYSEMALRKRSFWRSRRVWCRVMWVMRGMLVR